MAPSEAIPPILKQVIENAQKPHPPEADEAARTFVLGRGPLKDYAARLKITLRRCGNTGHADKWGWLPLLRRQPTFFLREIGRTSLLYFRKLGEEKMP